MRRERAAHDIRGDRGAAAFAQPHVERQQRMEAEQVEQPLVPRFGRAMARDAMRGDRGIVGGERWSALVTRVSAALADLAPVPTLVVTHGGAMRAALHSLCGFDQRQLWAFDLPYASLLSLRVWPGERPGAQIAGLYP